MARFGRFGRTALAFGAVAVIAAAILIGAVLPSRQVSPSDVAEMIEMTASNTFEPKYLSVKVGQRVVWKNLSDRAHTVSTAARDVPRPHVPAGAKPFHSGDVGPRGSFSHRFTVAGTYRYFCEHHKDAGMTGTVTVKPAR